LAAFIKHTSCDSCGSSDARAVYEDASQHCFSCGFTKPSDEFIAANQGNKQVKKKGKSKLEVTKTTEVKDKPIVTDEQTQELKGYTTTKGGGLRGIRDDTLAAFGVRTEYDEGTGKPSAVYYPCTQGGTLSGWKPRTLPKTFGGSIGRTGAACDLFGQFKFTKPARTVLIVGGEHDQLAAYQMLQDYVKSKGNEYDTPVVSPTVGETGSAKQLAAQYTWFDMHDKIVLGFDNDKAGKEAMEKAVAVLPKGKVFIANWSNKDPNEMLEKGNHKAFLNDFYSAKAYVPVGIMGSGEISDSMREEFLTPKIPLPPFMHKLQDMMAGGVPLGRIINLGSASGTGKSTIIDEIVYHMIFNSPHKVGVVTLESTTGQYGNKLLSRHLGVKLELKSNEEALSILASEKTAQKEKELFWNEDGTHRFYLVDDRDGGVENIKDAIENLVIGCGCKVIVADPVHDIIASLSNEEQETFYSWQKGLVKSHNCTFYNVMHTRKTTSGQKAGSTGADLHEEDIQGSSSAYKSAACNLMFSRNKESENDIDRNTTVMKATKIRWTGKTGIAGRYYYDNESHTIHDLDDYLNNNPHLVVQNREGF
jgi:KaiC/GvpD/RAD55 family RecA-like ATPase/ribosomal protein L37E